MTAPRTLATFLRGRALVRVGDLTKEDSGAIVNAANPTLLGGGGVDGAIHRAAGPPLLEACREVRRTLFPDGLPAGDAVATPGGALRAAFVIHTVGPVWGSHGGREHELLASCYTKALSIAAEKKLKSIYGIVLNDNAKMMNLARKLGFTKRWLSEDESRIELEL